MMVKKELETVGYIAGVGNVLAISRPTVGRHVLVGS